MATAPVSPSGKSRTARRCCSNWLAVPRSSMFELCGRIANSLTSTPVGVSNICIARTPTTPSSPAIRKPISCAVIRMVGQQAGRRRDHLATDAVGLDRSYHRVDRGLTVRTAGDKHGELAGEGDRFLGEQRRRCRKGLARVDPPHPATIVTAARRLEYDLVDADPGEAKSATSPGSCTTRQRGPGVSISASRRRITILSWACCSAPGPGRSTTPSACTDRRCSDGTCSWSTISHVAAAREPAQCVQVTMMADLDVRDDLSGAVVGMHARKQAQSYAERDGRRLHHPSQWLPPTTPTTGNAPDPLDVTRSQSQIPRDQNALDLRRALADLQHLRVPPHSRDGYLFMSCTRRAPGSASRALATALSDE